MLDCIHDDLIGEFEACPIAKNKIHFGQTFATRLRILQLKWMQHKMDSSHIMGEHLRIMRGIIRDLMDVGIDISEGGQVLNVIRALPDKLVH